MPGWGLTVLLVEAIGRPARARAQRHRQLPRRADRARPGAWSTTSSPTTSCCRSRAQLGARRRRQRPGGRAADAGAPTTRSPADLYDGGWDVEDVVNRAWLAGRHRPRRGREPPRGRRRTGPRPALASRARWKRRHGRPERAEDHGAAPRAGESCEAGAVRVPRARDGRRGVSRCSPSTATRPRCSPAVRASCRCWRCASPASSTSSTSTGSPSSTGVARDERHARRRRGDPPAGDGARPGDRRGRRRCSAGRRRSSGTSRSATAARSAARSPTPIPRPSTRRSRSRSTPSSSSRGAGGARRRRRPTTSSSARGRRRPRPTSCSSRPASRCGTGRSGFAIEEVARRHGDFALAGVACAVELGDDGRARRDRAVRRGLDAGARRAPRRQRARSVARPRPSSTEVARARGRATSTRPTTCTRSARTARRDRRAISSRRAVAPSPGGSCDG